MKTIPKLIHLISEEMGRSDAFSSSAIWKQKGDTLLAHAMLHILVLGVELALLLPIDATLMMASVQAGLYFIVKEIGNDVRREGIEVLPDSLLDTIGVFAGGLLVAGFVMQSVPVLIAGLLLVAAGWLSYPLREVLKGS